ncbi:MAG: multiheme c-type cytochrome, partial [Candidatus Hydrothermarchaeaceae archaeon]
MENRKLIFFALLIVFLIVTVGAVASSGMYKDLQAGKEPRYEVGEHKGAKFCASCHPEIYDQWSKNSRHAVATVGEGFLDFKDKFTDISMYDAMMGEEMCYACHGSKEVNEGVNCETCHGTVISGVPITETHEKKFKPGRENLKKQDFCAKCHT